MSKMIAHRTQLEDEPGGLEVLIHPASDHSVRLVLAADVDSLDGRSPWMWVRLPNGDLVLGVFPQGMTYESVELDAQYRDPPSALEVLKSVLENSFKTVGGDVGISAADFELMREAICKLDLDSSRK